MSKITRINTGVDFKGTVIFGNGGADFPEEPTVGQIVVKDQQLYAYLRIGDLLTWYPLGSRTRSYVHSQASASLVWHVVHNLGSTDVWYTVYTANGLELVNRRVINENVIELDFDEPMTGTVVVVAPDSISVPTISAGRITVGPVEINNNGITINGAPIGSDLLIGGAPIVVDDLQTGDVLSFGGSEWANRRQQTLTDGGNF